MSIKPGTHKRARGKRRFAVARRGRYGHHQKDDPATFELQVDSDGRVTGRATVKQTNWGMKPYSALFGALKVADEVNVAIDARIPSS